MEIQCICESQDGLGETPIWVEEEQSLYWADHVGPFLGPNESRRPTVKRLNVATNTLRVWEMPEQVGSFGFRKRGGPWPRQCSMAWRMRAGQLVSCRG